MMTYGLKQWLLPYGKKLELNFAIFANGKFPKLNTIWISFLSESFYDSIYEAFSNTVIC